MKATWRGLGVSSRGGGGGQCGGGGLAVAQQVRFIQGRIGALALFSPGKEGYLEGGGGLHINRRGHGGRSDLDKVG
jgi:hypothetical protein